MPTILEKFAGSLTKFVELHNEALRGDKDAVAKLLDNGADIDELDSANRTALMIACKEHRHEIALMLIERGADVFKESTEFKMTAFGWACGNAAGDHRVVLELLKKGCDVNGRDKGGTGWSPLMKATASQDIPTVKELLRAGADKMIAVDNPTFNEVITAQSLAKRISRGIQNGAGLDMAGRKQLVKLVKLDDPVAQEAMENGRLPGVPNDKAGQFNKDAVTSGVAPVEVK
jgi:ankyrin repeat protein